MALQISANTQFYWEEHGEGDPMVLISGYSANHAFWTPQLGQLAEKYRVILFDNPGIGDTYDKGGPLTVCDMAHNIAQFLTDLDIERAHIVGHSMGGCLGICLAALHPQRIKKLALLNSFARLRPISRHVLTNLLNMRIADIKSFTLLNAMVPWYFCDNSIRDGKHPTELIAFFVKNQHLQSIPNQSRQLDALLAFDGNPWLPLIHAQTLVVAGRYDLLSPLEDSIHLHQSLDTSQIVTLEAAHNMPQEIPQEVNRVLLDFFQ